MPNTKRISERSSDSWRNTPTHYPPWFPNYESFRAHVNALVARKEAEVRRGEKVR